MSNNEATGDEFPPFASDTHKTQTPESSVAQAPLSGWDNVIAAVRSATKNQQDLLLTLTADNMSPIWLDLHTKRYYTENVLEELPEDTVNPKLFAKLIDPNDPPFPWVKWRSIDAILWAIGEKAFEHKRARWLILGERYSLIRWPNLTQISYTPEELNAVSMLANGLLTIDELALVARISVEKSQQLISTLSFIGVLRGTGAPKIPVKVAEAMKHSSLPSLKQLQGAPVNVAEEISQSELVELPEETSILDEESSSLLADADHVRQQLDRPAISSMSLPELPEELYTHHVEIESEEENAQSHEQIVQVETELEEQIFVNEETPVTVETTEVEEMSLPEEPKEAPVETPVKSYREEIAARYSSMPSFESILAQQNIEKAAAQSVSEDEKNTSEEKPSGLFAMLRKLRLK